MIPRTYITVILLSLLSVVSTFLGVVLAFFFKKSTKRISIGIGFSTGVMLIISFFELLPEAIREGGAPSTLIALILGSLFMLFLDFILPHTHFFKSKGRSDWNLKTAYLIALGIILHDFPEGFAMANSYILSSKLGILIAISIAAHNIPEEFVMAIPLVATKRKKDLIQLGLSSALAEPLGAVCGLLAASVSPALIPLFLAFAAGAMIFISFHELYPMARRYKRLSHFALGVGMSLLFYVGLSLIF